jgi:hypothetical protein
MLSIKHLSFQNFLVITRWNGKLIIRTNYINFSLFNNSADGTIDQLQKEMKIKRIRFQGKWNHFECEIFWHIWLFGRNQSDPKIMRIIGTKKRMESLNSQNYIFKFDIFIIHGKKWITRIWFITYKNDWFIPNLLQSETNDSAELFWWVCSIRDYEFVAPFHISFNSIKH